MLMKKKKAEGKKTRRLKKEGQKEKLEEEVDEKGDD